MRGVQNGPALVYPFPHDSKLRDEICAEIQSLLREAMPVPPQAEVLRQFATALPGLAPRIAPTAQAKEILSIAALVERVINPNAWNQPLTPRFVKEALAPVWDEFKAGLREVGDGDEVPDDLLVEILVRSGWENFLLGFTTFFLARFHMLIREINPAVNERLSARCFEAESMVTERIKIAQGSSVHSADELSRFVGTPGQGGRSELTGGIVKGDVRLDGSYAHQVRLRDLVFEGHVDLSEAEFARSLDLSGCVFRSGMSLRGLQIDGSLLIDRCIVMQRAGDEARDVFDCTSLRTRTLSGTGLQIWSRSGWVLKEAVVSGSAELSGATIAGKFVLDQAEITGSLHLGASPECGTLMGGNLWLDNSRIGGRMDLEGASLAGNLEVSNCALEGDLRITLHEDEGGLIGGHLVIQSTTIGGDVDLSGLAVAGGLALQLATVRGNVICGNHGLSRPLIGSNNESISVTLSGSEVKGEVYFTDVLLGGSFGMDGSAEIGGSLRITHRRRKAPTIGGNLLISGSVKQNLDLDGLVVAGGLGLQHLKVGQSVSCSVSRGGPRPLIGGEKILISNVEIGGQLVFDSAVVEGHFNVQGSFIGGGFMCGTEDGLPTAIRGNCYLMGLKVRGPMVLEGIVVGGSMLIVAEIDDGLYCHREHGRRPFIQDDVWLSRSTVGGDANFSGATIGGALILENTKILKRFLCQIDLKPTGEKEANVVDTRIAGRMRLLNTELMADVGFAGLTLGATLHIQNSQVRGMFDCQPEMVFPTRIREFRIEDNSVLSGVLDLQGVRISEDFVVEDSKIAALYCGLASKGGDQRGKTQVFGDFVVRRSQITELNLDGSTCLTPDPRGRMSGTNVDGASRIRLTQSEVYKLEFTGSLPPCVDADGLRFQQFLFPGNDRRDFLRRTRPFIKASYVQMEDWLRNRGDDGEADGIYRDRRNRDLKEGGKGRLSRLFETLFLWPIGYGTKTYRLLFYWFLPVFALSWYLFSEPSSIEPTPGPAPVNQAGQADWSGAMKPMLMAVKTTLPMLDLATDLGVDPADQPIRLDVLRPRVANVVPELQPAARSIRVPGRLTIPLTYQAYAGLVSIGSWVAVPLAIAGLSGLVKRDK